MTDQFNALNLLKDINCPEKDLAFGKFYESWKNDRVVIAKWFLLQAQSILPDTLKRVHSLMNNEAFDLTIPNLARAVIGGLCSNYLHFHAKDGSGYVFLADQVLEMDKLNPLTAARLAGYFEQYPKLDGRRKDLMRFQLERIINSGKLSKNTYEVISKTLDCT